MSASTSEIGSPDDSRVLHRVPLVVSVVINFRGLADTTRCVESLLASTYPAHRVVVVDNGSGNGDTETIESRFGDRIGLLRAHRNLGYGGGANLGIRWAMREHAEYVWVLNNDTAIRPDAIGHLVSAMETSRSLGVASPEIDASIGPEAPAGVWFAGGVFDLARAETHHEQRTLGRAHAVVATGYVTGCAMFLRCEALEDAGLFWERLFLYWEDVDLSLRLRNAGWGLGLVPSATITHFVHGSVRSDITARYYFRNAILVARRHGSLRVVAMALTSLVVRLARLWASALLRRRPMPHAETRGLLAGAALALRWTIKRPPELASGVKPLAAEVGSLDVPDAPREAR